MAQIGYTNKVALNENPEIADINKITDDDMNEIKQVVNDNYNNTIQITDTEPTDTDNKLWIDTGEVSSSSSEIINEYSTSIGKGYSANISNGTIIYQDTTGEGTVDNITLTDSLNNYKYIDIICKRTTTEGNASGYSIHKFPANAPSITLDFSYLGANNLVEYTTVYSMSETSITVLYNVIKTILLSNNTSSLSLTNGVRITKIIGYKLGER